MLGTVQITHQKLSGLEVVDLCKSLETSSIKLLSLRECVVSDNGYSDLMTSLARCKSILQLNLNLGFVNSEHRAHYLAEALHQNRSLTSLFLHGSHVGKKGFHVLCKALSLHPNIVSLDIGDSDLDDSSMDSIIRLLKPNGAKRGLQDLVLSGNNKVSTMGWIKFFIALGAENYLHTLCLDYNNIRDIGLQSLCVALAACKRLETLDLESTGITTKGANLLLHLVKHYPVSVTELILDENKITRTTKDAILKKIRKKSSKNIRSIIADDSTSESSITTSVSDSGTETETNESVLDSSSDDEEEFQNATEYESDTSSTLESVQELNAFDLPQRLTPQFMATATAKSKDIRSATKFPQQQKSRALYSDTSSADGEESLEEHSLTETESEFNGTLSRPRPYDGYFSQALHSTASGTIDSPLHTVNSAQYAYSDISAS